MKCCIYKFSSSLEMFLFVVELKRLSLKCEFGMFLEEVMHDRLVCGLRNVPIVMSNCLVNISF